MSQILFTLQNAAYFLMSLLANTGGWSIKSFTSNTKTFVGDIGIAIIIILGAVMVIVALVKAGSGLLSHGKKQTEWVPIIVLLVVGVLFIAGGSLVKNLIADNGAGKDINDKLNQLGTGTVQSEF